MAIDGRNFNPTNKQFTDNFRKIANPRLRKGNLNQLEDEATKFLEGEIIKIKKSKIYQDGWEVKANDKTYHCSYEPAGSMLVLPEHTETAEYYIPKKDKGKCDIIINEEEKIYRIQNIHGLQTFFTSAQDGIEVLSNIGSEKQFILKNESSELIIKSNEVEIKADKLTVADVNILEIITENNYLINKIEELEEQIQSIQVALESGE